MLLLTTLLLLLIFSRVSNAGREVHASGIHSRCLSRQMSVPAHAGIAVPD